MIFALVARFLTTAIFNICQNENRDVDDDDEEDAEEGGREEREEPFPSPPLASTQADFTDQWVSQAAKATESGILNPSPAHLLL